MNMDGLIDFEKLEYKLGFIKNKYIEWNDIDTDYPDNCIYIDSEIVYNKFMEYTVSLHCDDWSYNLHKLMCDELNVELTGYKINYNYTGYDVKDVTYKYIYSSKGLTAPIMFNKRYDELSFVWDRENPFYYPERDCRILTHKILKNLRELDNKGVEYNKLVDDKYLRLFLGQTDELIENFKNGD